MMNRTSLEITEKVCFFYLDIMIVFQPVERMKNKFITVQIKPPSHSDKNYKGRTAFLKLDKGRENGMKCSKTTQFSSWFYLLTKLLQGFHGI